MSLNEEKCRDSLSNLYYVLQGNYCDGCTHNESEFCKKCNIKEDLSVMRGLVREYFELLKILKECGLDKLTTEGLRIVIEAGQYSSKKLNELRNKPLKFEELEDGMWVWDIEYKAWRQIHTTYNTNTHDVVEFKSGQYPALARKYFFLENRFYRKEVKDDD